MQGIFEEDYKNSKEEVEELDSLYELKANIDSDIEEKITDILYGKLKKMFAENSCLEWFEWVQYRNYFNDGDVCHFYIQSIHFRIKDQEEIFEDYDNDIMYLDNGEHPDGFLEDMEYRNLIEQHNDIENFLREHEDILEDIYGDNAKIRVNFNGELEIEDCSDHD